MEKMKRIGKTTPRWCRDRRKSAQQNRQIDCTSAEQREVGTQMHRKNSNACATRPAYCALCGSREVSLATRVGPAEMSPRTTPHLTAASGWGAAPRSCVMPGVQRLEQFVDLPHHPPVLMTRQRHVQSCGHAAQLQAPEGKLLPFQRT